MPLHKRAEQMKHSKQFGSSSIFISFYLCLLRWGNVFQVGGSPSFPVIYCCKHPLPPSGPCFCYALSSLQSFLYQSFPWWPLTWCHTAWLCLIHPWKVRGWGQGWGAHLACLKPKVPPKHHNKQMTKYPLRFSLHRSFFMFVYTPSFHC